MVSLSTKRRGVAVVAVLTLGLLFGIALLMMQHALPIAETNFSTVMRVSMTFSTANSNLNSETPDYFWFKNTAKGKVVQISKIDDPVPDQGQSKTKSVSLNEKLGQLFCLCAPVDESWDGELSGFTVDDVSMNGMVSLKLSLYDPGYYPCWRFGIESEKLVDKGPGQGCSVSNTVSMTLRTLNTGVDSDTDDDFVFVNTAETKVVAQYEVSQPGRNKEESKTVSLAMNEELGDLFCLCTTDGDAWDGEVTGFKVDDVSFRGVVTSLKLSTDEPGYYPCWRFAIESEKLVDKGPSKTCSMSTTVWMELYTTDTSSQDLKFVNRGKVVTQYKVSKPGYIVNHYTRFSLTLNEELGESFCLCASKGYSYTWAGRLSGLKINGVSFSGVSTTLKLSLYDYSDYYPCWKFSIESDKLVDKGPFDACSMSTSGAMSTNVWMELHSDVRATQDFIFVNTGIEKTQYTIDSPGSVSDSSFSLKLNEELGELFCLCVTNSGDWRGSITDFQIGGVSFSGLSTTIKLSTNWDGYYRCWRFSIESDKLVDKGGNNDYCN